MRKYILVFTILIINLISCTYNAPVDTGQAVITSMIDNIAILPFIYVETSDKPPIPENFTSEFNKELHKSMSTGLGRVKVINLGKSYEAVKLLDTKFDRNSLEYIPEFSRITNCDAVLSGEIKEYGERVGGEYGVEYPASFSFVAKLHDGRTGNIIWEDYYYEKQKPLLENVAEVGKFIKRKGKWVSTQEIAYEGIGELVQKLSNILR